jgi:hypothetical protein
MAIRSVSEPRRSSIASVTAIAATAMALAGLVPTASASELAAFSLESTGAAWQISADCPEPLGSGYGAIVAATPGLASYWRMDERTGDVACDSHGVATGRYGGGYELNVAGKDGSAASFDGTSGFLDTGTSSAPGTSGTFTIEAWLRPVSVGPSQTVARRPGQYLLRVKDGTLVFRVYVGDGRYHEVSTPEVLEAGVWQHVAATDDGDAIRVFHNGAEVAAASVQSPPAASDASLLLGASGVYDYFGGRLDEVALYEVALTAEQIAAHYAAADTSPPDAPPRLLAEPDDGAVTLHWDAEAANTYRVYRQTLGDTWSTMPLATTSGGAWTDGDVANGATYVYRVTAVDAADNESSPSPEASATPAVPGTVLWRGDVEEGTLDDWSAGYGGGVYNSGEGVSVASAERVHSGSWAVTAELPAGEGGVRLFRWAESRRHRTLSYSVWYFIPRTFTLQGDRGRYWILNEFKSSTPSRDRNDPFWYVNAYNRPDGTLAARLAWGYQSRLEGPHEGELGWRNYGDVALPIGRWFPISIRLRQSSGFDGAVAASVDGEPLAAVQDVRTGWPNCTYNSWCVDQAWAVTSYSDGLAPAPAAILIDDAEVSR